MASGAEFVAPNITRKLTLAAAGHEGVLRDDSGALIIKPALPKEIAFYQSLPEHPEFAKYTPSFMGTLKLAADDPSGPDVSGTATPLKTGASGSEASIVLSNAAYGFTRACVVDIKLGAQLWDDDASLEKRTRLDEVSRSTTSTSLGFRIAGMKVWNGDDYQVYDKMYGRTFTADNVIEGFREYYKSGISEEQRKVVVQRHLEKVEEIAKALEGQESRMYSASLLFVYEGDAKAFDEAVEAEKKAAAKAKELEAKGEEQEGEEEEDEEDGEIKKVEELRVIDFAHADWTPGQGPDKNALQGVYSVIDLLKRLS